MMRHMNDIHILPTKSEGNCHVMPPQGFFLGLIELFEIRRKRAQLVKVPMRANKPIFVLMVDRREIAYEIPDVGSNTELVNLADVNGDAHMKFSDTPYSQVREFGARLSIIPVC